MKHSPAESTSIDWDNVTWDKVDDFALAILYFGRHEEYRTWKGLDWEIMNRLHAKGYISDPVGKAKSVFSRTRASHDRLTLSVNTLSTAESPLFVYSERAPSY
jgi:hypothetical protein